MGSWTKRYRGKGDDETTPESPQKKKIKMEEVFRQRKKGKSQGKTPSKEPEIAEKDDTIKSNRQWAFRAGLGHLHDLFVGKEEDILVLNDIHRDLLATTAFWSLLQVFINNQITKDELKIPQAGLKKLTDSYIKSQNGEGEFLVTKEEGYESTPQEMALIFGMQMLQNVFFTKNGGSRMSCSYIALVESIDVVNNISWPHLIRKHMMHGIEKSNDDYRKIDGCAFYLLYWYAERSNQKIDTRDGCTERFPRFTRWSTNTISRTIDTLNS
ncbi:hypothetical protein C5167_010382 [Papaver somniferum]|uniref:Uncharacterized protein n=1 Tax=Papaver somniferum TaxID=3469 RepID=A0A4Y7K453_PAPSO|nr:hypothetical protein C5167_010382 [Papaver somniferum]